MKHFTALLFAFLSAATLLAQEPKAVITFNKTTHDFGTIYEANGPVTCTFTYRNTGNANLVIHQAVSSCGCTNPIYSNEPLRPGEEATLTVTYDGTGKSPGTFSKRVTLRTNAKDDITVLHIKGTMIGVER